MKVVAVVPISLRFCWEAYCFLDNLKTYGLSSSTILLVYIPHDQLNVKRHEMWDKMEKDFPEVEFFYYRDEENFTKLLGLFNYIPLLRPKTLSKYWELHPEMEKETIWYVDTDVLFTKKLDFSPFLKDDVIYISDAKSYTNYDYLKSKDEKFVDPSKYEDFKRRNFIEEFANIAGITEQDIKNNNESSGAAQYLIKKVDKQYWEDVLSTCITLKIHMANVNQQYFKGNTFQERENNGWQSWCADIWAVQWQLIKRGRKIITPKEFDFLWTTDNVSLLTERSIYHNAGISSTEKLKRRVDKEEIECPVFYKGKKEYTMGVLSPYDDVYELEQVISHPVSGKFCVAWYCQQLLNTKYKYNL